MARSSETDVDHKRALELARQWKREHPESHHAWERANPERVRSGTRHRSAKWRAVNRRLAIDRSLASRAKNPEGHAQYNRRWAQENPARCRAKYKRYMSRKMRAMPSWASEFLIQQFYDCCTERNELRTGGVNWHVDHVVPLQGKTVCGLHVHENLQVVPGKLNLSKGNRFWPDMWPPEQI